MRKYDRFRLLTVLLIIVAVLVTACGGAAAPTEAPAGQGTDQEEPAAPSDGDEGAAEGEEREPVTLTYWTAGPNEPLAPATQFLVDEFMKKYPWITVEVEHFAFGEYFQKIDTATAAGTAPDVFWVDNTAVPTYAYYETILPLDEFVSDGFEDDYFPIPKIDMYYNDTLWAIPMHQSTEALLYNREIVEAAGVEPPTTYEDAWTFEEFREAAEKVTQKSGDTTEVWGYTTFYPLGTYSVQPWIVAGGGALMDPERTTYLGYTNGEKTVEVFEWYGQLFTDGLSPIESIPDIFQTGKVAFTQANPFVLVDIQNRYPDLEVGVTPLPCEERCAVQSGGYHVGIHAQTEHPDEAWLLVDYLTNEGHMTWIERTGYMPARISVYEQMPKLQDAPWDVFIDGLAEHAVRRPINEAWPIFNTEFTNAANNVVTGADAKAELDRVAQTAEEELKRFQE